MTIQNAINKFGLYIVKEQDGYISLHQNFFTGTEAQDEFIYKNRDIIKSELIRTTEPKEHEEDFDEFYFNMVHCMTN